jgi:hypothetical protein
MAAGCEIRRNNVADEITARFHRRRFGSSHIVKPRYPCPGLAVRGLCGKLAYRRQDTLFWSDILPASYDKRASPHSAAPKVSIVDGPRG